MIAELPSFRSPPLNEVVLGISTSPIPGLGAVGLVKLWQEKFAGDFPTVQEQPPYEPPVEVFDGPPSGGQIRFGFGQPAPASRLWLVGEGGTSVVQIQKDWFAVNWRRHDSSLPYSRYEAARQFFVDSAAKITGFLEQEKLGPLVPRQCELSYVNRIEVPENWANAGDMASVVRLAGNLGSPLSEALESAQSNVTAVIVAPPAGKPVGRLHISARTAVSDGNRTVILLTLTARGGPLEDGLEGALAFLDLGHRWVVRSFLDVTTDAMHERWERYE